MPGIYISWPFCAQKCTYCNFASGVSPKGLEALYLKALRAELSAHEWQWKPETLYIGGGTPSAMDPPEIASLMAALPGMPGVDAHLSEATVEAAPGSLSTERVNAWRQSGINRFSLGVQSFNKTELARTGRKHNAQTVIDDVALLRATGIGNINIDLIAGLPGQTETSWRETLAMTAKLEVPHVSVYMLEVDDESRLGAEIQLGGKRYGAMDVPSENAIGDFYELAVAGLAELGIHRYEISNFARPGAESAHNMKYWRHEPYIGFGADAHSFDGVARWPNVSSAESYVAAAQRGESPRLESIPADAREEKFFVGLRLAEGVHADEADWLRFGPVFERFLADGMLERTGERLRLTSRGVMVSNEIFEEFITL